MSRQPTSPGSFGPARAGVVAVAQAAGVAPSTVSNVYNRSHVVAPATRERVREAADRLGYTGGDPAARSLRHGRTNAIGLVMRERLSYAFEDPAVVQLVQGISDATDSQQLALVIVPNYPERGTSTGPAVRHAAVDGLILYSLAGDDPLLDAARARQLPTVVVDSPVPTSAAAPERFSVVGINEQQAARTAVQHLLDLGHHRVGILSTRLSAVDRPGAADPSWQTHATASVPKGRLAGACQAITAAGQDWADVPVVQAQTSSIAAGRAAAHALLNLAPHITAVFAFSDPLALGAGLAARERGLAVPADLSIIGFDDSAPPREGLTSIHQPLRDKGRAAATMLLRSISGNPPTRRRPPLPTTLVIRESTSAPPQDPRRR